MASLNRSLTLFQRIYSNKFPLKMLVWVSIMALARTLPFEAQAASCIQSVDPASVKFTWTGYKFTEKVDVSGTFDSIDFRQTASRTAADTIKSIRFTVDTASINSDNPPRDKKLALFVFGSLINPGQITGRVSSYDEKSGKATAEISLNGVKKIIPFIVKVDKDSYSFQSKIDLLDFKMNAAYKALHEACEKLHVGKDGKAVTWTEVGLAITANLTQTCT